MRLSHLKDKTQRLPRLRLPAATLSKAPNLGFPLALVQYRNHMSSCRLLVIDIHPDQTRPNHLLLESYTPHMTPHHVGDRNLHIAQRSKQDRDELGSGGIGGRGMSYKGKESLRRVSR